MGVSCEWRGNEVSQDEHAQTTSFEVELPGGVKAKGSTKQPYVLIAIACTAALVVIGLTVWQLMVKVDILTLSVQAQSRLIREQICLAYSEAERAKMPALACRKMMGDLQ